MIRVTRPAAPAVLGTKGAAARTLMEQAFAAEPEAYRNGTKTFEVDSAIYGSTAVKTALKKMQAGKCAFCESKVDHVAHGDVEHFRPKVGVTENGKLIRPGYYWLAYEWTNLFFACQLCNQAFKKNLFPLEDTTVRARAHLDDLAAERPLLLDPARDDPAEHLTFASWTPVAREGSPRGRATIEALGLDRPALEDMRRERFAPLHTLRQLLDLPEIPPELRAEARSLLLAATDGKSEYAAMARALLAERPLPDEQPRPPKKESPRGRPLGSPSPTSPTP